MPYLVDEIYNEDSLGKIEVVCEEGPLGEIFEKILLGGHSLGML